MGVKGELSASPALQPSILFTQPQLLTHESNSLPEKTSLPETMGSAHTLKEESFGQNSGKRQLKQIRRTETAAEGVTWNNSGKGANVKSPFKMPLCSCSSQMCTFVLVHVLNSLAQATYPTFPTNSTIHTIHTYTLFPSPPSPFPSSSSPS